VYDSSLNDWSLDSDSTEPIDTNLSESSTFVRVLNSQISPNFSYKNKFIIKNRD
jgi:hypothetical protein